MRYQTISQINQSLPVTLRLLIPVAARWTSRARHGTAPILPVSVDKQLMCMLLQCVFVMPAVAKKCSIQSNAKSNTQAAVFTGINRPVPHAPQDSYSRRGYIR